MDILVYKESLSKNYLNAFYYLKNQRKIKSIEIIPSKPIYYLLVKLNNHSRLFRAIRYLITKKKNMFINEPTIKQIFKSFISPIILLTTRKKIILGVSPYSNQIYFLFLLKFIKKDLIYYNSWPYWKGDKYVKKPFLFSKSLWRIFLKNTKAILVTKKATKELKDLGVKSYYIPHSIDTKIFSKKLRKFRKITVLYVGRFIKEKGIYQILSCAKQTSKLNYIFIGEGPLNNKINLKNTKVIPFIKNKNKLVEYYSKSHIFVLPSYATKTWEEFFGIALIEAMASSLPVIATDCTGPKEIIKNNGFIIKQKDEKDLLKKIRILAENKELREKMGEKSKKLSKQYDTKKVSEKLMKILENSP
jgi:glycosyltransferase involved in cell wall biosynthesis